MQITLGDCDRAALLQDRVRVALAVLNSALPRFEEHNLPLLAAAVLHLPAEEKEVALHHDSVDIVGVVFRHQLLAMRADGGSKALVRIQAKRPFGRDVRVIHAPVVLRGIVGERVLVDIRAVLPRNLLRAIRAAAVDDDHALAKSDDGFEAFADILFLV
ncbi:hypothetical protein SDC9_132267 [bioreactor metagenome]|uniref:Uncharacterized protein n=1 Tax=bioreactor metagenome TaxID=1076179 RepID=A0A645D7I8_9ZZZZ